MISRATMNLKPAVIELNVGPASKCLRWVISGHSLRFARCPVFPQKRTLVPCSTMSALCHKRTFCAAKGTPLFDHLIGPHGIFTDHGGGRLCHAPIISSAL